MISLLLFDSRHLCRGGDFFYFLHRQPLLPLPFTSENVQSTLLDILSRQDDLLLTGLIDSIQIADRTYVCNDGFKFNNKVIFEKACFKQWDQFVLKNDGAFKDAITFLSKVMFCNRTTRRSTDKTIETCYLWGILNDYFTTEKPEKLNRDEVAFKGGLVTFFNNGNAHLTLDDSTRNFLNDRLSGTKGLKAA